MTTFNAYYQSELAFLRDSGKAFSKAYPDAAQYLADSGSDPDVERLLEGVAFLTGRIRQRLDDGLPEIIHPLIEALLPHFLRPLPALTILQFSSTSVQRDTVVVPAGALVDAIPRDGTACRFRTTHAVHVTPLRLVEVRAVAGSTPHLHLQFQLPEGARFNGLERLRLFFGDDPVAARALYFCLSQHDGLTLLIEGHNVPAKMSLSAVGLGPEEALLPHPATANDSHRLLLEWFAFPTRMLALDLAGFATALPPGTTSFIICVAVSTHARLVPPLRSVSIQLHTTPAVNLFQGEAEPLCINGRSTVHRVRPAHVNQQHMGIFSITGVIGRISGSTRDFPLERRWHRNQANHGTWLERRRPAVLGHGADVELEIDNPPLSEGPLTLSLDVLCTNRDLPTQLGIGDIRRPGAGVPPGLAVRNLMVPTTPVEPILGGDLQWRLLGHLSLDRTSLLTIEGLREALSLYNIRAQHDQSARHAHQRLSDALISLTSHSTVRLLEGIPIRGLAVTLHLDEEGLGGIGEAHIFGQVLDSFLAGSVTLNAFTRLTLCCSRSGHRFTWPDRLGLKRIL